MDIIDNYISLNLHYTNNPIIMDKTWTDFENECKNKQLILYGITGMTNFLWLRCKTKPSIIAAIDSDTEKQNHSLNVFFDDDDLNEATNVKIKSKNILKTYNPEDVVIFISSLKSFNEIANELEENNFHCYFSVLNLEYNYRQQMKQKGFKYKTQENYKNDYMQECLQIYNVVNNKIMFYMVNYIDHGKYITNELLKTNKHLDIVWAISNPSINVPQNVRTVTIGKWKQFIYEIETAKLIIYNGIKISTDFILKRNEQKYIQMKHWGSITLKKFGLDDPAMKMFEDNIKLNGELMDYIIVGSKFDENSCRSGYNFKGKFIHCGSPRSDIMFQQNECKTKICNQFNLEKDEHILMYAPTFRVRNAKVGDFNYVFKNLFLNFDILMDSIQQRWHFKWKIFLRLHPSIRIYSKRIKKPNFVVDVSNYDDNQELAAAADIMISDYSSLMFEPAYVLKPVFLYAPDKDEYVKNEREFLIDYESLPFPISTTNEELVEQIKNFDEKKYKQDVQTFLNKYGVHEDGHASERAAKFIAGLLS